MDSKDQNLDLTQQNKSISVHFNPFSFAGESRSDPFRKFLLKRTATN